MFLSDLSIKRPVMMCMLLAALLMFGVIGYNKLPLSLMPDVKVPYITVQTIYAGASPTEIESQITKKIEDEVASLALIDEMISYSMENASIVMIKFDLEKDEEVALQEVKDKVDQILNKLPDDANTPVITKLDVTATPVMNIIMSGDLTATELYDLANNRVKDRISQVQGVGKVDIVGGMEREIRVELDKRSIYEIQLSLTDIVGLIKAANQDMPVGNFKEGDQEYSVRLKGQFETVDALKQLDIPTSSGVKKLWQLGEVKDANKEVRQRITLFDAKRQERNDNSLLISVVKNPTGNTVATVDAVTKILPDLEKELGNNIRLTVVSEDGTFVKDTANDAFGNIYQGVILTALILLLFFHDFRSTLIVALAMPISIIPTFMIMNAMGMSLNVMSLMGLSTASGTLISGAVTVLENIFRRRGLGEGRKQAAATGTSEVAVAVMASLLTNIVVFLPIGTMSGIAGLMFKDFALTVVVSTVFSLISSFTVTPMLAALILPEQNMKVGRFGQIFDRLFDSFAEAYGRLLRFILTNKKRCAVTVGLTSILFVFSLVLMAGIPADFIPAMDNGNLRIEVELPLGYTLEQTAGLLEEIEERVKTHPEVITILTNLGKISSTNEGVNVAVMKVKLTNKAERKLTDNKLAAIITEELSDLPNAQIRVNAVSGFSTGNATVDFYLQGQDVAKVEEYAAQLVSKMRQIPGLMNINTSSRPGKAEITIYPDRVRMTEAGLTVQQLAVLLRTSVEGLEVTEYRESGNEYDVRVVLNDAFIPTYDEFKNLPVTTKNGTFPISHFGELRFTKGYNKILHTDKYTSVEVMASLLPGYALGDVTPAIEAAVAELKLPTGYRMAWTGNGKMMAEVIGQMAFAFFLAIVLTFMLLAATVENFTQPLLILTTVPLCLIGVGIGLVLTGASMSIFAMLSIVMLVGMVVNNAILILDHANQLKAEGMTIKEALLEACPVKLKAVIMANLAAILGMLPMAMGIGASGAEIRQPMGIVSISGILSSTILTLVFIPAMEVLVTKKQKLTHKRDVSLSQ
ncbi:MAG TPA: efflux RND transporter permease subunit [Bacillota bacterium]|nr:efflux RND transporter permease subunit [Bacillota bacterium]HOL10960.1 efflux RND transporter permease subunit [Bacillota bacterium]HPO98715.1 efflux RND transporter permease subunit [Bacillota bacterium]